MESAIRNTGIVLLMDTWSEDGRKLFDSLVKAGYDVNGVVVEDDGFLPDGVISMKEYFLGDFKAAGEEFVKNGGINANIKSDSIPGHPRYFNQIEVPEYWSIQATNTDGQIMDKGVERAHIYYAEPKHKRLVSIVEWTDIKKTVRCSDHYNKYGALYARTVFNARGERVSKTYFGVDGAEIITENLVTKDILLNCEDGLRIFRSKADFVAYFLKKSGLDMSRIMYNTLSTSFFSTLQLEENNKQDIMFWQENTGVEIPGNMKFILNGNAKRTERIYVQKKAAYDRLIELGASPDKVKYLGYIYDFKRENLHRPTALVCTNSDQVVNLEKLLIALPEIHFNVAALTEMSSKLMDLDKYDNISLYPCVKTYMQKELFEDNDIYLDINREGEILDAVHTAFMNNMLILGFSEVAHNRIYVPNEHILSENDLDKMIELLKNVVSSGAIMDRELEIQHTEALCETAERYRELIQ